MTAEITELSRSKVCRRNPPKKKALTEQRVADLTEPGFTFDTKVPGLAVRITSKGSKSYVFQRKIHGRPLRFSLGKCAGLRLDAARDAASQWNGKIAAGIDIRSERAEQRAAAMAGKPITFEQAFEAFKKLKQRRASTLLDYETIWRLHIPAHLKAKSILEISSHDIEALKIKLMTPGKGRIEGKSRTAGKVVTLIGAILNKSGRRNDNPARDVEKPESRVRTRRLSGEEITSVFRVLDARRGELFADFIAIAVLTGARRGALCAMRWQDLDLVEAIWMVPAEWSKNRREIVVPLPSKAIEILSARKKDTNSTCWVWPSNKAACGHIVNPEKPLKAILQAACVTTVSMHDLRRTLGSRLAMTGAGSATITAALGHISPQSARAYVHLDVKYARAAMEKAING